ncbi:MAG TPA: hypothetical protein VMU93_05535 [Caulobacteraceae bacterium]|nr:hypothetical protein [Caulobacteraceae bacterium]
MEAPQFCTAGKDVEPCRRGVFGYAQGMRDAAPTPTISRVLEDGTLIELVYDPIAASTALAIKRADASTSIEAEVEVVVGERLVPYSPRNNLIATECVLLPSDIGDFGDKGDLLEAVSAFLHRYVDLSTLFEVVAAHYVLLTWVYDAFSDLPYLRFRGDYGTGKTRALLAVGSLCYKPFFASGASTVSPIFHIQDAFQGTLVLDEADFRFSDQTAELTKVLNNGTTRGMPVLRTMTNRHRELNPTAFRVFGPKIIAMRESFSDRALESRFITEETGGAVMRDDIPVHLPDTFKEEARTLRSRLLAWRFHARHVVGPDPSRLPIGLSPRVRQTSLALLSIIDDPDLRNRLCEALAGEDARLVEDRDDTLESAMVESIIETFAASDDPNASVRDITSQFNTKVGARLGQAMSNRWVGSFVRRRLRLATHKTGGVYVIPPTERARVDALAQRYGVAPHS